MEVCEKTATEKQTIYPSEYSPHLLEPIPRSEARREIGISLPLPFCGSDIWNAYEISVLNKKGKPQAYLATFSFPHDSPFLIESKSLKLYLNSLNQMEFANLAALKQTLHQDLEQASRAPVAIQIEPIEHCAELVLREFHAYCIDHLDVEVREYHVNPSLLQCEDTLIEESLFSNLLRSNCPMTGQPDWASVYIRYQGRKINHASLLRYLVSYRLHNDFGEPCVERIFFDILQACQPEKLTVFAKYTRRGGLDINPFRSNFEAPPTAYIRSPRQ